MNRDNYYSFENYLIDSFIILKYNHVKIIKERYLRNKSLDYTKLCIIVPAFNEADNLPKVIKDIRKIVPEVHIVVINDGSTDNTKEIIKSIKVAAIHLPTNLGIGGSVQTGIKYAQKNGFTYAMQVDGDGQHNPKYITTLFNEAEKYKTDLTIGSRYLKKTLYKNPFLRQIGQYIFSGTIQLATGKIIKDTTSGFRVFGPRTLPLFAKEYPVDFPEPESIVRLLKYGYSIREFPVEMNARQGGVSSVDHLKAFYLMLSIPLSIAIDMIRPNRK